jgi:hypothetical protein
MLVFCVTSMSLHSVPTCQQKNPVFRAFARLGVGPTCFPICKRLLASRSLPPHCSNVRWGDLITLPDELKTHPATSELSRIKVERQTYGMHLFRDACNDVVGKSLGCGTAYQQLPRSPTSEILQPR